MSGVERVDQFRTTQRGGYLLRMFSGLERVKLDVLVYLFDGSSRDEARFTSDNTVTKLRIVRDY